jgi:hypothetical protein
MSGFKPDLFFLHCQPLTFLSPCTFLDVPLIFTRRQAIQLQRRCDRLQPAILDSLGQNAYSSNRPCLPRPVLIEP